MKRAVQVTKSKSRFVTIGLTLSWDPKETPQEQQQQIWEGIGATLAAAMTGQEREKFLQELRRQTEASASANAARSKAARKRGAKN